MGGLSPTQCITNAGLLSSPALQNYINIATQRTSIDAFGDDFGLAVAFRAQHMYVLDSYRPMGEGGEIFQKREGSVQMSFGVNKGNQSDGDLSQTYYGRQLRQLIIDHGLGASVTGMLGVAGVSIYDNPSDDIDLGGSFGP